MCKIFEIQLPIATNIIESKRSLLKKLSGDSFEKNMSGCEREGNTYMRRYIDIEHYYTKALDKLGIPREDSPPLVKCVRGISSANCEVENLAKGILRAKHGLQVNKDGTIRFDCTELPITSFKPKEIDVSLEKIRKLGYEKDIYGEALVRADQVVELMPHDILLPSSSETPDEKADDVFLNISKFIDDELTRFYGIKPFYNCKTREDLIGQLGVCMAPHNCAGVVVRVIGFSKTLGLFASPYLHAAIRRDCDGDEAAIMLLSDVLLNFSRKFLPSHRGGTQDAPLVLNAKIDTGEVDDQILDFEFHLAIPLYLPQENFSCNQVETCQSRQQQLHLLHLHSLQLQLIPTWKHQSPYLLE